MINTNVFAVVVMMLLACTTNAAIDSKEYKAMLYKGNFTGSTSTVTTKLASLKTAIDAATAYTISGNFALKSGMPRTVKFYDTVDCDVYKKGYAFRMRRDSGKTNWEGTLKFRDASYAISDDRRTDMNQCATTGLGEKFELDISLGGSSVYAFSQNCEIDNSKNINILDDIEDIWNEIGIVYWDEFGWNNNKAISQVAGMTITERVYEGVTVAFPGYTVEFGVSLWYTTSTSTTPVLAELSFTTSAATNSYVDTFWTNLPTSLSTWIDPAALFKTKWVYKQTSCTGI